MRHSQAKAAKAYKAQRGLNGVVEIGYNSGKYHHGKDANDLEQLVEIGLLKPVEAGYQMWANNCLIFGLRDKTGAVQSLYGRSVYGDGPANAGGHFYMRGRKGLFPCYPDTSIEYLILTESIIDAQTLMQVADAGNLPLENYAILALYGTNGLTAEHRSSIKECSSLKEIVFALDADASGKTATLKHSETLSKQHPNLKYSALILPDGEDVNSLYVTHDNNRT